MDRLKYVGVALVAGTVGALVALMVAPDSGANTRREVQRLLDRERARALKKGRRLAKGASGYLEEQLETGRRAVTDLGDEVYGQVAKGKRKIGRLVGA